MSSQIETQMIQIIEEFIIGFNENTVMNLNETLTNIENKIEEIINLLTIENSGILRRAIV